MVVAELSDLAFREFDAAAQLSKIAGDISNERSRGEESRYLIGLPSAPTNAVFHPVSTIDVDDGKQML